MSEHPQRLEVGAYLLGGLEPRERAAFEAHLAGCDVWREEVADLAGLPALLGRLSADEVLGGSGGSGPAVAARAALTAPGGPGGWPDDPSGTADLTATRQGSAVALRVWGVPAGQRCALVLVTRNGVRQQVATWVASYDGGAGEHGDRAGAVRGRQRARRGARR